MKWKRFGSSLLAIVLVCCLIFNMMCVPAKALSGGFAGMLTAMVSAPATPVVAAVVIGLGIGAVVTQTEAFDNLVVNTQRRLQELGWINGDKIECLSVTDPATGAVQYAVPQDLIADTHAAILAEGAIVAGNGPGFRLDEGAWVSYGASGGFTASADVSCYPFYIVSVVRTFWLVSSSPFSVTTNCANYHILNEQTTEDAYSYVYNGIVLYMAERSLSWCGDYDDYLVEGYASDKATVAGLYLGELTVDSDVQVGEGLAAGTVIGSNALELDTTYSDWKSGSIDVPSDDPEQAPVPYWPVSIGQTYEATRDKTQEEIWSGVSEYMDQTLVNWAGLFGKLDGIRSVIESLKVSVISFRNWCETLPETLSGLWQSVIVTPITNAITALGDTFPGIRDAIISIPGTLSGLWQEIIVAPITTAISAVTDLLTAIKTGEITIPQALADVLTAVVVEPLVAALTALFVPSADYLSLKVDALRAEFGFADSIITTADSIRGVFNSGGSEPPVIYIDLGATRGSYNMGGKVKFIDMHWYAEYKPTVDKLLAGLIWLVFCWKMFKRLPGIISGMPGDFVMDGLHSVGLDNYLPSRNAAYEVQRQELRSSIRRGRK